MNKSEVAKLIDHTLLKPDTREEDVVKLCKEAREHGFASVCINPVYVETAKRELAQSSVMVCTVVGFPLGANTAAIKAMEAEQAVTAGADEIDMVLNIGLLKAGNRDGVLEDISGVVKASQGKTVKVILETGALTDEEKIVACQLAVQAGAHFVKTSTGFGPGGATAADIKLMRQAVGPDIGVKASGGVRTYEAVVEMVQAGASRIGTSGGVSIIAERGKGNGKELRPFDSSGNKG